MPTLLLYLMSALIVLKDTLRTQALKFT